MTENQRRIASRPRDPFLFRPMTFRSVTARNRIAVSPMCQYSAKDGVPDDWHLVHLGSRAVGGAGIVFAEATHVEARGRITPHCLGLWNETQRDAFARIASFVAAQGAVPAIQLGHAGRKAGCATPWQGSAPLPREEGGWDVIGPSPLPFAEGHPTPAELDGPAIEEVLASFARSTAYAREAGFKIVELHAAHGYLLHSFLSPLSNRRDDDYGGSFDNRIRLLMRTLDAMRRDWPAELPLFIRISASDWVEGGWDLAQSVELAKRLKARGDVDLVDCSSGGNDPRQQIPLHPGYQAPFADVIRREAGIPTGAVGLIHSPDMAELILASGQADLVFLGRTLLCDPYWPIQAAKKLRADVNWPVQYERGDIF
jgi:2,4-dienoyl-CoA reductase-like NADH-dependent reductase (Old Yellow Enzyme family)